MSPQLINRSPDLLQLQCEGYEVEIKANHLVLNNVPYVNAKREIKRGRLISVLELNGEQTIAPKDHKAYFAGEHPCDANGNKLRCLEHASSHQSMGAGLIADHSFSAKPKLEQRYQDYHHKMSTYASIISKPARAIDPDATPHTYIVVNSKDVESVFHYSDTASTRAGIQALSEKLAIGKVAIIGLGGTGAYLLDLIAKTPVQEIHLFDGDDFYQHNAFRYPGAPSLEKIREKLKKVNYLAEQYSRIRKNIVPHTIMLDDSNLELLDDMSFVFICIDSGAAKKPIVEKLETYQIPFIDAGMGVLLGDDKLTGIVRVTAHTPEKQDHFNQRVSMADTTQDDVYSQNIQIADLNSLNAALAVIKWKKMCGFYADFDKEHSCNYTIDGNLLTNLDKAE